jgi:hypothetical protein
MSRMGTSDAIVVKPTNNIYTVLTLVALIAAVCSLAIIYVRAGTVFTGGLFGST